MVLHVPKLSNLLPRIRDPDCKKKKKKGPGRAWTCDLQAHSSTKLTQIVTGTCKCPFSPTALTSTLKEDFCRTRVCEQTTATQSPAAVFFIYLFKNKQTNYNCLKPRELCYQHLFSAQRISLQATHRKFPQKVFFQEKQHQDIWWGAQHLAAPQSPGCSSAPSALITLSAPRAQATRISKPASQGEQGGKERNRNTSWLIDTKDIKPQRKVTERALLLDPGHASTVTAPTPRVTHTRRGVQTLLLLLHAGLGTQPQHKPFRLLFYFITMTSSTPKNLQSTTGIT